MQCKEFASVLEQQGISPLPQAAQDHLAGCASCQDFFADLSSIVAVAHELPGEVAPPQRIWVSLRAQLEAEGLIKEPSAVVTPESSAGWLQNLRAWFTPRSLATAGVGIILAMAAFSQFHKPMTPANSPVPVAKQQPQMAEPQRTAEPQVAPQIQAQVQGSATQPSPRRTPATPKLAATELVPAPSTQVYQADAAGTNPVESPLSSSALAGDPAIDESLQKNLRIVNEFIAECESHLKKYPQDTLAREYLNSAYQQKAQLIAAMLDSGRSEQ